MTNATHIERIENALELLEEDIALCEETINKYCVKFQNGDYSHCTNLTQHLQEHEVLVAQKHSYMKMLNMLKSE